MATCKDCFHWEACKTMCEAMRIIVCDDFQGSADRCENFVNTADVAPRAEVAREIFEEIEKHLFVIAPIEEFDGWARIQLADIMRLKKKYTEAEPSKES